MGAYARKYGTILNHMKISGKRGWGNKPSIPKDGIHTSMISVHKVKWKNLLEKKCVRKSMVLALRFETPFFKFCSFLSINRCDHKLNLENNLFFIID